MFDIVFKNLLARKTRTLLCILTVLAGVFLVGITLMMNTWMYAVMTDELGRYMGKVYVQQSGSGYPPIDSSLPEAVADDLLSRSDLGINVAESTPLLFLRVERGMMPFLQAKVMVIGVPVGNEAVLLGDAEAVEGVNRFDAEAGGDVAILGEDLAQTLAASLGGEIQMNNHPLKVIGILEKSDMATVNISAVVPLNTAQHIFARDGQISALLLTPTDVLQTDQMAAAIRRLYPSLEVSTQADMLEEAQKVMRTPLMYMSTMGVTGVIVAVIMIMSTMLMAVTERTREIGTLRALGARRGKIVGMVVLESIFLALFGLPLAIGLVYGMSMVTQATSPSLTLIVLTSVFAVVTATIGSLYPAWRAARVEPLEALRYE
jgi:putative ABC transport system permease protein